jgi:uncharacterized damage-inducible protein DinB
LLHPGPLFRYNWQVRQEWFRLLADVPEEELAKPRHGGYGSILRTLCHIVLVEQGWIRELLDLPEVPDAEDAYPTLAEVVRLSGECRGDVECFVDQWEAGTGAKIFETVAGERRLRFRYEEVVAHVIAHEIHHAGQLSVWAREIGLKPPSANVIFRGLY